MWLSERYWDKFLPEDAGFPHWTSIHRQTILIFIYMLVSQKNKGTKPGSLPKYNSLSEIMGGDTTEKSASTFCSFWKDILLTSCVKIVTDIVLGWKMTIWVTVRKHDKLRKAVPYCSTLSCKQERYCRKQNEDFLCLLNVFQKQKLERGYCRKADNARCPLWRSLLVIRKQHWVQLITTSRGNVLVSHPHQKFICYRPRDRKTVQAFTYCLAITMGAVF